MDSTMTATHKELHVILFDSAVHGLEKLRRYKLSALGSHGSSILRINNDSFQSRIASIRYLLISMTSIHMWRK